MEAKEVNKEGKEKVKGTNEAIPIEEQIQTEMVKKKKSRCIENSIKREEI